VSAAAVVHVVVSRLATGSIYSLMALSLVIVYNATRTLNAWRPAWSARSSR
jgi:branched-subunit amino acid ABC-type transport system permease component